MYFSFWFHVPYNEQNEYSFTLFVPIGPVNVGSIWLTLNQDWGVKGHWGLFWLRTLSVEVTYMFHLRVRLTKFGNKT